MWDVALDLETGDFMFSGSRDLLGVSGPRLDVQRIHIRVRIPRGSFLYDREGRLGSNLHLVTRSSGERSLGEARASLMEALADMEGISVKDVVVDVDERGNLFADVKFRQTASLDADGASEYVDTQGTTFSTRISLGHEDEA